jgi:hypothetical protein
MLNLIIENISAKVDSDLEKLGYGSNYLDQISNNKKNELTILGHKYNSNIDQLQNFSNSLIISLDKERDTSETELKVTKIDSNHPHYEIITCSICLEAMNESCTMICGHSNCLSCLKTYKAKSPQNILNCPSCRKNHNVELCKNTTLDNLIHCLFPMILETKKKLKEIDDKYIADLRIISAGYENDYRLINKEYTVEKRKICTKYANMKQKYNHVKKKIMDKLQKKICRKIG